MKQKPNILLVVADCARADKWLGPDRKTVTPNIDRLCRRGVALPTTIVEKSCTTPSFSTLLTGLYSPRHGVHLVWGYRLPDQIPMLTRILTDEGYHCYAEMTGPLLAEMGLARGFEHYEYRAPCDYLDTAWGDQFVARLRDGHYRGPWFLLLHLWELHPPRRVTEGFDRPDCGTNSYEQAVSSLDAQLGRVFEAAGEDTLIIFTGDHGQKLESETYRPDTAVDYAQKLLALEHSNGMTPSAIARWAGPSVLQQFYGQCAPMMRGVRLKNAPVRKPSGWWTRLADRLRLLRLTPFLWLHDLLSLASPLKLTEVLKRRGLLDEDRARGKIGRFVRAVGEDQVLDMHMRMWANSFRDNLREGHIVHVYDFLVRVPLVITGLPGLPAGMTVERMVRQPDILPTVLESLGIDPARLGDIDGRSFRALLTGAPWTPLPAYLSLTGLPADLELRGVRTEEFKYTYGPENSEMPEELYDLRSDPGELLNLASSQPARCAELRQLACGLLPSEGEISPEMLALAPSDQERIEKHLQELGYIE